jgi:manganese oxidase
MLTTSIDQLCRNINPLDVDTEDSGQKAFNYRSAPTFDPVWLTPDTPPTPIFHGKRGRIQNVHLVAVNDKPRAISIHIHGHTFTEAENAGSLATGVDNAINPGRTETITFRADRPGDWAVRAGNVR